MSAVCILAPTVIASWPAISAAVAGAATALGMSVAKEAKDINRQLSAVTAQSTQSVEVELENSEVVSEGLVSGQEIVLVKGDLKIRVSRDERGRCCVCVDSETQSKSELRSIGEQVAGKITQIFVYNKVMTEMRNKGFTIVKDELAEDQSVHIQVRRQV